jgi:hypothetical protein
MWLPTSFYISLDFHVRVNALMLALLHQNGIYCQICFFVGYFAVETLIRHERTTHAVSADTWLQLS